MTRILFIIFVMLLQALPHEITLGQSQNGVDILKRCEKNYEGLEDYAVDLEVKVDMERVRMPKMAATMYFKRPNKIFFESPNFAMLPREGFGLPATTFLERYEPVFKGEESLDSVQAFKLLLVARSQAERLQQLMVWVNRKNYTVARLETVPYQGRSVKIEFSYGLQDGYWLPVTMQAQLAVPVQDTVDSDLGISMPGGERILSSRRTRSGTITVSYLRYRINTGLSDDIFQRQQREGQ